MIQSADPQNDQIIIESAGEANQINAIADSPQESSLDRQSEHLPSSPPHSPIFSELANESTEVIRKLQKRDYDFTEKQLKVHYGPMSIYFEQNQISEKLEDSNLWLDRIIIPNNEEWPGYKFFDNSMIENYLVSVLCLYKHFSDLPEYMNFINEFNSDNYTRFGVSSQNMFHLFILAHKNEKTGFGRVINKYEGDFGLFSIPRSTFYGRDRKFETILDERKNLNDKVKNLELEKLNFIKEIENSEKKLQDYKQSIEMQTNAMQENEINDLRNELEDYKKSVEMQQGSNMQINIVQEDESENEINDWRNELENNQPSEELAAELRDLRTKIEELENKCAKELCKICMKNPKNTVFVKCGHMFYCNECFENIIKTHIGERFPKNSSLICPICKVKIKKVNFAYAY